MIVLEEMVSQIYSGLYTRFIKLKQLTKKGVAYVTTKFPRHY